MCISLFGGLDIKDTRLMNRAMLAKTCSRMLADPKTLITRVHKAIFLIARC